MSPAKPRGHIKLARKMFDPDDLFWLNGEPFTKRDAWIDLIQMAAFGAEGFRYRGVDQLHRGEFVASVRYLAERWQWSKSKVQRFLAQLSDPNVGRLVGQREGQHGTIYLLAGYERYNPLASDDDAERGTPDGTPEVTNLRVIEKRDTRGTPSGTPNANVDNDLPAGAGHPVNEKRDTRGTNKKKGKEKENYSLGFETAWALYPARHGGNSKADAWRAWKARVVSGVSEAALRAGVERYAAFCDADGKVGTPFVMQAARFFGPSEHYAEAWAVPVSTAPGATPSGPRLVRATELPMIGEGAA